MIRQAHWYRATRLSTVLCLLLAAAGCSRDPAVRGAKFMAAGKERMAKKDYARAVLQFRNAVRAIPNDAEAHYQLGLACFYTGDRACALAGASKAAELKPGYTAAQLLQAQVLSLSDDPSRVRAAEELAEAVLARQSDPQAFDSLALAEMRLGKTDEAEAHLKEALARFPSNLSLSVKLAALKLSRNDLQGAEQALRDAVAKDRNSPAPAVALGSLLLMRGNLTEAEQQFRAALQLNPKDGAALFSLLGIQYRTGRRGEAKETLRILSELPGEEYKPFKAVYLFLAGERDKAVAECKRLYESRKGDRQALSRLVTAYAITGRFPEAMAVLDAEVAKNRNNLDALLLRAQLHLQLGALDKAEADLAPALSSRYRSSEAHYIQSTVWGARGQQRQRKQELFESLEIDPLNAKARIELSQALLAGKDSAGALQLLDKTPLNQRQLPAIVVQRNWVQMARNEIAEAEKGIDLLLASERPPEAVLQKAVLVFIRKDYAGAGKLADEFLLQKPGDVRGMQLVLQIHAAQQRVPEGIEKLKQLALLAPKSAPAQVYVGGVLKASGDPAGARAAFEAAIRANPGFFRAHTELAVLDVEANKPAEARQRLAAPAAKNDPNALLMLADLDYKAGNLQSALDGYRKVAELDADNIAALNNAAYLLVEHAHDLAQAMRLAERAKGLAPENASVDDTLGWVQYQAGSNVAALASFQRAVSREPNARRMYHLAMAYFKAGNRQKGVEIFEKAYKLDPTLPEARLASMAGLRQ